MSVVIRLTESELAQAATIATARMGSARARGASDRLPTGQYWDAWGAHVLGICGEQAVARQLGLYWPPSIIYRKGDPDIPPDIEVRTANRSAADLVVRSDDDLGRWFVLATLAAVDRGLPSAIRIVGRIRGTDARRPDRWLDRGGVGRPAWFVAQADLIPIEPGTTAQAS